MREVMGEGERSVRATMRCEVVEREEEEEERRGSGSGSGRVEGKD